MNITVGHPILSYYTVGVVRGGARTGQRQTKNQEILFIWLSLWVYSKIRLKRDQIKQRSSTIIEAEVMELLSQ